MSRNNEGEHETNSKQDRNYEAGQTLFASSLVFADAAVLPNNVRRVACLFEIDYLTQKPVLILVFELFLLLAHVQCHSTAFFVFKRDESCLRNLAKLFVLLLVKELNQFIVALSHRGIIIAFDRTSAFLENPDK